MVRNRISLAAVSNPSLINQTFEVLETSEVSHPNSHFFRLGYLDNKLVCVIFYIKLGLTKNLARLEFYR
jgi:hypothetical protein